MDWQNIVTLIAGLGGAIIGAVIGAWFTYRQQKQSLRLEVAKGALSFLSVVLNSFAPEVHAANTRKLQEKWAEIQRGFYLAGIPEKVYSDVAVSVAAYLTALEGMHRGTESRDEVESLRAQAKLKAKSFMSAMGM